MNASILANNATGRAWRFAIAAGCLALLGVLLFAIPDGGSEVRSINLSALYKEAPLTAAWNKGQSGGADVSYHGTRISVEYHKDFSTAEAAREMINSRGASPSQPIGDQACYAGLWAESKGSELTFRRYNIVASVLKEGTVMRGIMPELDQIQLESVARILDDAILQKSDGVDVVNTSIGREAIEAMAYDQLPGNIALYFYMGSIFLAIALIPIVVLWLLARFIRNRLARIAARSAVLAFFLAPGMGAGEGGIYVGPGYLMILGDPGMIRSIFLTWVVFFGLAIGARLLWAGKLQ